MPVGLHIDLEPVIPAPIKYGVNSAGNPVQRILDPGSKPGMTNKGKKSLNHYVGSILENADIDILEDRP
jgi:hypothetical protein